MKGEKKKRGFFGVLFRTAGLIILIALVLSVTFAVYVIISMKRDPVITRTIQEYADSQPDESFSHLFFTLDGRMTQAYSEEDVGYFISRYLDESDIDPSSLVQDAPVSGLELRGFKIELEEGKTAVCAEGVWRNIRLVARVFLDIACDGGEIAVSPSAVEIAGIRIPVSLIDRVCGTEIGNSVLSYAPEPEFLKEISDIRLGEGEIILSGPMATEILDYAELSENRLRVMRLSQSKYSYAAAVLDTQGDDPAVRYSAILPVIEEDPDEFIVFLDQLFTVTSATATRKVGIGQKNFGIAERWFPGFDEYGYDSRRSEAYDEYYVCFRFLSTISARISDDYSYGRLRRSGGEFLYYGEPFSFEEYFGSSYKLYRPFFGMEEGRMCTAKKEKGSSEYPAMLLRGNDGCGFAVVIYGSDHYSILPLKEDAFIQYLASDTVPELLLSDTDQFGL